MTLALPALSLAQEDLEVLTRGPVHEAFAESVNYEANLGLIVTVAPPEPIEELPPEQRPEGESVEWIPGYWAWDDDRNDFLWVSGVWRNVPPGRRWVPGYWSDLQDGRWQWTSGYWADADLKEVAYLATEPPRSLEAGPSSPAPSSDSSWVPGVWSWQDTRYAWRPGYWTPYRDDWTWVPARYCRTPRGYVFVDGYWDHAVDRRRVLFAPVYFHRPRTSYRDYRYTPSVVVALEVFFDHLFYRPSSCHYYFGDYYDRRYRQAGWYASFHWHDSRRGYDPIYAHKRWRHRNDRGWDRRYRDSFDYFVNNEDRRPPHTWSAMRKLRGSSKVADRKRVFADTLTDYAKRGGKGPKFRALDPSQREELAGRRSALEQIKQQRNVIEANSRGPGKESKGQKRSVVRKKLTRSSIVGRRLDDDDKGGPPAHPKASDRGKSPGVGRGPSSRPSEAGAGDRKSPPGQARKSDRASGPAKGGPPSQRKASPPSQRKAGPPSTRKTDVRSQRKAGPPSKARPRSTPSPKKTRPSSQKRKGRSAPDRSTKRKSSGPSKSKAGPSPRRSGPPTKSRGGADGKGGSKGGKGGSKSRGKGKGKK